MKLCKRCIEAIKSRGEIVYVGPQVFSVDDVDYGEEEEKCDWCEEVDDLYDCKRKELTQMKPWVMTCTEFKGVRKAIDDGNIKLIVPQLIAICEKYAKKEWDFAENYEEMAEELREIDVDELEEDDVDFYLHDFYDLCDSTRVWLDI